MIPPGLGLVRPTQGRHGANSESVTECVSGPVMPRDRPGLIDNRITYFKTVC